MKLEHIGLWTKDLEAMKDFYVTHFKMSSNEKYVNEVKGFSSYFLTFESGTRIELMHRADIKEALGERGQISGMAHMAFSLGSVTAVIELTERSREMGLKIIGEPRTTGDGYFESVIEDPEGNWIELTA
ncbi:VOC family protein [Lutimonas halocynthiae]|uniref:VOC family protein n=1 Tax=Lutimonas halocynthiae TaxID=1446477 RepID=UPI0025B47C69|nr:VOC family protein [Lutimonas halocynthiae]MDN3643339.1 VOC family protein [Lutimonas halocynthiae]